MTLIQRKFLGAIGHRATDTSRPLAASELHPAHFSLRHLFHIGVALNQMSGDRRPEPLSEGKADIQSDPFLLPEGSPSSIAINHLSRIKEKRSVRQLTCTRGDEGRTMMEEELHEESSHRYGVSLHCAAFHL